MPGVLINKISPQDFIGGQNSPLPKKVIKDDGQWISYPPKSETQKYKSFDAWNCVSMACNNCIEFLTLGMNKKEINISDRVLAVLSGTIPGVGNYLATVADTLCKKGFIFEEQFPTPYDITENDFYKPLTSEVVNSCKVNAGKFQYDWVHKNDWIEYLQYAPLQVIIRKNTHSVALIGYKLNEFWWIFDSYYEYFKQLRWDYDFNNYAVQFTPVIKQINNMEIKDNFLYKLVQGTEGKIGLGLDNRLIVNTSEQDKFNVFMEWFARNNGNVQGKIISIKLEDWEVMKKVNLKGEPLS